MRIVRYLLVQFAAYGLDVSSFWLLMIYLGVDPLQANFVGKILAGLFAFAAHRSFTFGVNEADRAGRQAMLYFALLAVNLPLSTLGLSLFMWIIPITIVAKFVADVVCVLLTYWLSKRFIFLSGNASSSSIADGRHK